MLSVTLRTKNCSALSLVGLLTAVLFFCILPANGHAEEKSPTASKADESTPLMGMSDAAATLIGPCKGLKHFKDVDELMFQIYSNLESECLFKMDPKELVEIWQIPAIVSPADKKQSSYYFPPSSEGKINFLELDIYYHPARPAQIYKMKIYKNPKLDISGQVFFPHNDYPKLLPPPLLC